ncbi:hypothetical protein A2960_00795 [Candidatus Gottesmanbacteria bacterium RIFCSPLOWO2_01_FULL_39_12b]|uniref:Glycosyltransferase RgtA/B/C/D-like domain-containing protein n=1 Tax=Candidatus Gottesmanbacteria bacterium RIFCSPLOWO2_01_FULL_39_12b TaxID=1798388 RepID=A0A1F6APT3_9BACT|nr:MAG: hypothetical protein A2960_00795 [Candidatus Gottesmanbacteria bacterium RIFCSPLOWO2_01_FULL_39_12b]
MKQILNKYTSIFFLCGYFLVNLVFFHSFWAEIFFDNSKVGARYGEVFVAEWAMDKVYQNIMSGKNPFAHSNAVLYPFGLDFTSTDSGNGFYFVLLRPFFSEHQSLAIIVAAGLIFSNIGMYLLLRKLGISQMTSYLLGLAFGYMTFLTPRVGHLNFMSTYVFPWFFLCGYSLFKEFDQKTKFLFSAGTALFFVLSLYLNLYYFIMIVLSISLFAIYGLIFSQKSFLHVVKDNLKYILLSILLIVTFLIPWLKVLYETYLFEGLPKTNGWGGAIEFSSDLFGFFIPSIYSYFLSPIAGFWGTHFKFASRIFENFSYPGLFIIFTFITLFILKLKNKLPPKLYLLIRPYLYISGVFWILTLGPFLHILGKWGFTLDDEIRIVIPLPFVIFHYLPFMANIRIPGRLIVAFIFFSYIICAYLFDYLLSGKGKKIKTIFFFIFIAIFFLDHYFKIPVPPQRYIPYNAYKAIANDPSNITVMEAPSVVRDGFTYFGNSNGLEFVEGQNIHKKPVLAGYMGRIPYFKSDYYKRNPFLGYMGRLMDDNLEYNGGVDKSDLSRWKTLDYKRSIDSINFLDLKYFLLDDNRTFAGTISAGLTSLGFNKTLTDNHFSLWQRNPDKKEYLAIDIGSLDDDMFLGAGWNVREEGFRWSWKNASIMFKVLKPRKFNLNFRAAAFYKDLKTKIYLNKKKITEIKLTTNLENFSIPINQELSEGINFVYFLFSSDYRPSEVIPGNFDNRLLSAKFTHISLEEIK